MSDGRVRAWLATIGAERYADTFTEHEIDWDALPFISEADLKEIGVAIGPRRKMLEVLAALREGGGRASGDGAGADAVAGDSGRPHAPAAERRQLTIMFCDLVGSTTIANLLDPEDLRTLMQAYQQSCGAVIERYGGHVAQYLGDGLMTYFGWPQAHEDDAERAVRASLEIVGAVKEVSAPEPLQVRIGIATGPVVVGDTGTGDASVPKLAVGGTPNLAARIQTLAGADAVVVSPTTRRILGGTFDLSDLGMHALKGIVEPVRAWRVVGVADIESRFEARTQQFTPFVGREGEIAQLIGKWEQAREGDGQVVLLCGEPGIGKSRVTQVLGERVAEEPHMSLRYQCSPYHRDSALYPFINQVERAAGFAPGDDSEAKLDKLERLLASGGGGEPAAPALLAAMLGIDSGERYPPLAMRPQKQKEETLAALVDLIAGFAVRQPVLMIFEDTHWIDPTSQEALDMIVRAIIDRRILLLVTFRPEQVPEFPQGGGHLTTIALSRLGRRHAAVMVAGVTGGRTLPDSILDQIVAKTDGIPLFVEELTKTVIETGIVVSTTGGSYVTAGAPGDMAVPATLQDSLMARLDRLPAVKEVAQIGACIGREFPYELLAAVSALGDEELGEVLRQLTDSELVFRTGTPASPRYVFKHALVQDAAYRSLLKPRRRELHRRIAETLTGRFPDTAVNQPELIARHYTEAGADDLAVAYWARAGARAAARFASREAVRHIETALSLLATLAEGRDRDERQLALLFELIAARRIIGQYPEALTDLARAEALSLRLERAADRIRVHHFRGNMHFLNGDLQGCLEQHRTARAIASEAGLAEDEARALGGLGDAHYALGRMRTANRYFGECLDLCAHHGFAGIEVTNRSMLGFSAYYSGDLAQALVQAERSVELARAANEPRAEIIGHYLVCSVGQDRGDWDGQIDSGRKARDLAIDIDSTLFEAVGCMHAARGFINAGRRAEAEAMVDRAAELHLNAPRKIFAGAWILAVKAVLCTTWAEAYACLQQGEALLTAECLAHNHLEFRRHAIDLCLSYGEWQETLRHTDALQAYTAGEPLDWARFFTDRGRALSAFGQGDRSPATADALRTALRSGRGCGFEPATAALETALAELEGVVGTA